MTHKFMLTKLKEYLWYSQIAVFCIPYVLSRFVTKDRQLWVFGYGSGDAFTDNSKHLYLYVAENVPEIRPVWITENPDVVDELRSEGYEVYHTSSPRAVYYSLRATFTFVTHSLHDVLWWCAGGSTVVRLNHGIPFKKSQWANPRELREAHPFLAFANRHLFWNYDMAVAPSESTVEEVAETAGVDERKVLPTGFPRTDAFFHPDYDITVGCDDLVSHTIPNLASNHRLCFMFWTWRLGSNSDGGGDVNSVDVKALNSVLKSHDAYLLFCVHQNSDTSATSMEAVCGSDRIIPLSTDSDFYPALRFADVAITDYSSLYYDYLLAECPIILHHADVESYLDMRELVVDLDELPGERTMTSDEFLQTLGETLRQIETDEQKDLREYRSYRDYVYGTAQGGSCARLTTHLRTDQRRPNR